MMLVIALLSLPAFPAFPALSAQHAAFRVKGRVVTDRGEPIADAAVRAEAFYGYAAGTFSGQRIFTAQTNGKGEWSIGAMQPGIWQFDVVAPGCVPETIVLPIRILTTVSMGTSGMALTWDLLLKPLRTPDDARGKMLGELTTFASDGKMDLVRAGLERVPGDADADYLAGAGNVAMLARDTTLARALYQRALERDPSSYRAALGVASIFLRQRDFDSASRAFDAARNRTRDRDELKFLSAAIGDLATIKVR
jgi:tetratricopeptide (TPR) repeat protein